MHGVSAPLLSDHLIYFGYSGGTERNAKEETEKREKAQERKRKWKDILDVKKELIKDEDEELLTVLQRPLVQDSSLLLTASRALQDFLSSAKSRKSSSSRKVWANDLLLPTVEEVNPAELKKKKVKPVVKEVTSSPGVWSFWINSSLKPDRW